MSKSRCQDVRRELEEIDLGGSQSKTTVDHLSECEDCRDVDEKQRKLQQIVASLGTIAAPADFDFKLRARLANEKHDTTYANNWFFSRHGVTATGLIVLLLGVMLGGRYLTSQRQPNSVAVGTTAVEQSRSAAPATPSTVEPSKFAAALQRVESAPAKNSQDKLYKPGGLEARGRHSTVVMDSSSERAPLIHAGQPLAEADNAPVFPITAPSQALRVSLDDGRGNARTVSVPTVTFGSQRVLATANRTAPKDVW